MEPILAPTYLKSFTCIGSECPRTCCARWTVPVDAQKKREYDNCPDKKMHDMFEQNIAPFKEGERAYRIVFTDEGMCPFLNPSDLCNIRLRLGAQMLPAPCAAYPMRGVVINGAPELSAVLSCPVTAGLALWLDGRMRFEDIPGELPPHIVELKIDAPYAAFAASRNFLIEIIQYQKLPFESRLILLGMFIERCWNGDFVQTAECAEEFRRYMHSCASGDAFSGIRPEYSKQFALISKLLEGMAKRAPIPEYGAILQRCGEGLNKVQESLLQNGVNQDPYAAVTRDFKKGSATLEIVFENYFANEIFRESAACAGYREGGFERLEKDGAALKKAYMLWCASYRMLYFQFACLNALQGSLARVDVVDIVNLFCRSAFTHDVKFSDEFSAIMSSDGFCNVGELAGIITS